MNKFFYIFLLIEISFGVIVIEPERQIQNSIYYDPLDEELYYRIGDVKTSFKLDSLDQRPLKSYLLLNYEWSSDYLIQILYLHKNFGKYGKEDYKK